MPKGETSRPTPRSGAAANSGAARARRIRNQIERDEVKSGKTPASPSGVETKKGGGTKRNYVGSRDKKKK